MTFSKYCIIAAKQCQHDGERALARILMDAADMSEDDGRKFLRDVSDEVRDIADWTDESVVAFRPFKVDA